MSVNLINSEIHLKVLPKEIEHQDRHGRFKGLKAVPTQ